MSPRPTNSQRKKEAETAVAAARAEGKLIDKSVPAWRQAYERDPVKTQAEPRSLTSVNLPAVPKVQVTAEGELLRKTRAVDLLNALDTWIDEALAAEASIDRSSVAF
jgi:hypothetical protein